MNTRPSPPLDMPTALHRLLLFALCLFGPEIGSSRLAAALMVAAPFQDSAILQRDRPVLVSGRATPGDTVHVRLGDDSVAVLADAQGRWRATLPARPAWARADAEVRAADQILRFTDLLFGDVWLAAGQSNIGWTIDQSDDAARHKAEAHLPGVRVFAMPVSVADAPRDFAEGRWTPITPDTLGALSAVAYHFARRLHHEVDAPVGILQATWGGTWIESWIPRERLAADPELAHVFPRWQAVLDAYPAARARYEADLARWQAARLAAGGAPPPGLVRPQAPRGRGHPHQPASVYNALTHPLAPTPLRGVLWYQGESNAHRAWIYRRQLPVMVAAWRELWADATLPFVVAQLPRYGPVAAFDADNEWAALRESQRIAVNAIPHATLAVLIDTGDPARIHPGDKLAPGIRLADTALAAVYGRADLPVAGPRLRAVRRQGSELVLDFSPDRGALRLRQDDSPRGFVLAGADRVWRPAVARLEGDSVRLAHPDIPAPVAARYAWAGSPDGNLTDAGGLPAEPFRTDDWDGPTDARR